MLLPGTFGSSFSYTTVTLAASLDARVSRAPAAPGVIANRIAAQLSSLIIGDAFLEQACRVAMMAAAQAAFALDPNHWVKSIFPRQGVSLETRVSSSSFAPKYGTSA